MAEKFQEIIELAFQTLGKEEAEAFAATLRGIGDAGDDADGKLSPLIDEMERLGETSAKVADAIDLSKRLQANDAALADAKATLAALNAEFSRTDKSSADIQVAFEQAEKRVRSLAAEQLKLQTASASANDSLKKAGVDTSDLAKANDQLKGKAADVAQEIGKVAKNAADAGGKTKTLADESKRLAAEGGGAAKSLGGIGVEMGKIAAVAGAAIAAFQGLRKVADFAGDSLSAAASVEQSLSRVQGLARGAAEDFTALGARVDEAAAAANVSVEQSAAAAAALAAQGQSAKEIYQTLIPTMLLAKDANIDVAQAAGLVDDALDRFGLSADQAGHVVDVLVASSKGAKDGLSGISDSMGKLAPLARDIGLTFEQTAGILGLFAQNGQNAETASKGLRSIFEELSNPASQLRQDLFALGDSSGDFSRAIDTLTTSGTRGRDAIDRLGTASKSAVLFLQQQGPGALKAFTDSISGSNGAALTLAQTLDQNLKGAWQSFTLSVDALGEKLAAPLLTPLQDELKKLAGQLNAFANSPAFEEIKASLATMFQDGVRAFDDFIQHFDWRGFVDNTRAGVADASASIKTLADNIGEVSNAVDKIGSSINVVVQAILVAFNALKTAVSAVVLAVSEVGLALEKMKVAAGVGSADTVSQLQAIRDAAQDAADNGVANLFEHTEKMVASAKNLAGANDEATAAFGRLGTASRAAVVSFLNVSAGANSTRAALERFDVPPGTFRNVTSGANDAAKALADLASRTSDAQRAVSSAQADFDRLARSGTANSEALRQAASALDQANTRLAALKNQSAAAAAGTDSLKTAMAGLGITLQSDLSAKAADASKNLDAIYASFVAGKASIEDVRAAFEVYSQKQLEAVKNSDNWKQQQVKDAIEVKAAMLGVSQTTPSPDFKAPTADAKGLQTQAEKTGEAVAEVGKKGAEGGKELSDAFAQLSGIYAGWINTFNGTSRSAALRFQDLTKAIFEFGVSSNTYIQADTTGIAKLGFAISEASRQTQAEINEQKTRVQELSAQYEGMSAKAIEAMAAQQGGAEGLARALEAQAAAARDGQSGLELLGASDLGPLASALDGVAAKARQLAEQAESARESFANMAAGLDEQIAQANGDLQQAENVRFQNALENLRKQAEASGTLNSAEYADAVAKTTALHNIKLKQLQDQADAQRKADEEAAARKKEQDKPTAPTKAPSSTKQEQELKLTINGKDLGGINLNDPNSVRALAQKLLPEIIRQLQAMAKNFPGARR